MPHVRHHNANRAVLLMLLGALSLAGCGSWHDMTDNINWSDLRLTDVPQAGVALDRKPPPVNVVRDGANGELIAGAAPPLVPDAAVDQAVAEPLRALLTGVERRRLAEASQRAAADFTLQPIAWEAIDPSGAQTAIGTATAVDDVYRAVRGDICRDVRQSLIKGRETHQGQVTLCRRDFGSGLYVWVAGLADR
jgi:surface antigen